MNHIQTLALATAVALLAASGGAQAAEEDNVFLLVNSTENVPGVFTGNFTIDSKSADINGNAVGPRVAGDTFIDDFILQINDPQDDVSFYVQANTVKKGRTFVPGVSFTGFILTDLTGAVVFDPVDFDASSSFISADWTLNSGTYDLEFTGFINANGGGYAGPLTTTPVPEPTGWALMMAGLGAMGMLARRRKNLG